MHEWPLVARGGRSAFGLSRKPKFDSALYARDRVQLFPICLLRWLYRADDWPNLAAKEFRASDAMALNVRKTFPISETERF
jgi:hypothetical protein